MAAENFHLHEMCAPNIYKKHFFETLRYVPCQNLLFSLFLAGTEFLKSLFISSLANSENLLCNAIFSSFLTASYPAWQRIFSLSNKKEKKPLHGSAWYSIEHAWTKAQILSADKSTGS